MKMRLDHEHVLAARPDRHPGALRELCALVAGRALGALHDVELGVVAVRPDAPTFTRVPELCS